MSDPDARVPDLDGEDAAMERIRLAFAEADHEGLRVGPGHDCAVLVTGGRGEIVVTSDVLVDGVHFELDRHGAEAAGAKALLVNLSDLAAAAAFPLAFEVGVVLPRERAFDLLDDLTRGLARVATQWGCPAAGGDTNVADGPLVIAVTAFGTPHPFGVVTRHGARPGDVLSVTGPLGGSGAGRHMDFTPRLAEAEVLARLGVPHAMMDLSDGLGRDLPRLVRASGVGAEVQVASLPVHPDVSALGDDRSPLEHVLGDGEDFELLVAHAPVDLETDVILEAHGVTLHTIGRVLPAADGLTLVDEGRRRPWPRTGYDHLLPGPRPADGA